MSNFDCENVDVEDFLECLDIYNVTKATANEYRFSCPFPNHSNGDENASSYMNEETTAFFCHGCKERGNAISFTAQVLGISPLEAIRMLKQRYQPGGINPDSQSMVEEVRKIMQSTEDQGVIQPKLPDDLLLNYEIDWEAAFDLWKSDGTSGWTGADYIFGRGFFPEVLREWEFGYDERTDRITLAIRDEKGTLIGFKARSYREAQKPKYLVLGDKPDAEFKRFGFERYYPSGVVFGAHKLKEDGRVVVCEGELNAIAVASRAGIPAVAINGSHFTDHHAKIIRHFASEVVLFLDNDKAGKEAVWGRIDNDGKWHPGIIHKLKDFVPVLMTPPRDNDAAEMDAEEIRSTISEAQSYLLRSLDL